MTTQLEHLQREMQQMILQRHDLACSYDAPGRAERLAIYANAYASRLHEALAHNFSTLESLIGHAAFAGLAGRYIDAHPSTFASIRAFGDRLPTLLASHRSDEPWLPEVAALEWALGAAFDAPNQSALTIDALSSVAPHQWPQLRFEFARAAQRLDLATNAAQIYESVAAGNPVPAGHLEPQPAAWLIWRQGLEPRYRSMGALEVLAFDALAGGCTFGEMCERLLDRSAEDEVPLQAAAYLKRWIADELIVTFECMEG